MRKPLKVDLPNLFRTLANAIEKEEDEVPDFFFYVLFEDDEHVESALYAEDPYRMLAALQHNIYKISKYIEGDYYD